VYRSSIPSSFDHPPAIGEAHLQAAAAQWVADAAADAVDVT